MQKASGIGGMFFRAKDPETLARWYAENLGIDSSADGCEIWQQEAGPTVWAPFTADTEYFGRPEQTFMINFRVANLDAMLAQLRAAGAQVDDKIEEMEGVGRFGWVSDPEGNRFELWEPAPSHE